MEIIFESTPVAYKESFPELLLHNAIVSALCSRKRLISMKFIESQTITVPVESPDAISD